MKRIWNPATFTVSSLSIRLCVPYATARNIVVALLDAGMAEDVGQQKHEGPGKPQSLYRLRSCPGKDAPEELETLDEQLWQEKLKTLREPKFKQPGEDSKGHIQHAMDGDF